MKNITRAASALLLSIAVLFPLAATALSVALVQTPTAACVNGAPQVNLKWSAVTGATSYSVFRSMSSSAWVNISSKKPLTSFLDTTVSGGTSYQYQVKSFFGSRTSYSKIVSLTVPTCGLSVSPPIAPTPPPPAPSPTPLPAPVDQITMNAYVTGYGWPDNTPPSAEISNPVIHQSAGGAGTYADPITIAVGHSIVSGKDILDYPQGTKFYIPALRRYFIVEDTCGDGNSPQNGPCHTGYQGHVWLDAWVGGQGMSSSGTLACEDTITDVHTIIENPAANYAVTSGPIFSGTCASLSGESVVLQ